jgi:hypothetical protein
MTVKIFNSLNIKEYQIIFCKWLEKLDIYYDSDYLMCESKLNNSELEIYTVIDGINIFIYPYLKLKIDQTPYFDIISPYGYAGPYSTNIKLLKTAEKMLSEYLKKSGCITEFIRYHFNTPSDFFFCSETHNSINRKIVTIDLKKGFDRIWIEDFSTKNRNLIRKIEKDKYEYKISNSIEDLNEFIDMYNLTMKNVYADAYYFFDKSFFYNLFEILKSKVFLARVIKDGITYSSALFFISGGILTYYLSARNLNFQNIPATNFLLSESIKYGINNNLYIFNLGGGRSINDEDALLKFKLNFSKGTNLFYIGKRIHNQNYYESLISQYISKNGFEEYDSRKHILQFYRQ